MSTIHQIYCTHCTHGSSALERREGDLASRMLGYSARAGSLDAHELRRFYRQVERYLYYYLPRDTPAEDKLRLAAATAPRRLIYLPSTNGLQMVGQICYRPTDTEGRPGSYFAHVLFREEKEGQRAWSVLDALRLWQAPGWVLEDSPQIPFRLSPLKSPADLLASRRPAIDDGVFLSFLTAPAHGSFDDPVGVIPARWRHMDPGVRAAAFTDVLAGFLDVPASRRESLLLVAEPSVAALVYYGIARLLPPGELREAVSFSTYEPNGERTTTALAATWFVDPEHNDVRPETYRSRGFVLNTYNDRRSEGRRVSSAYAESIVRCLREDGWQEVEHRFQNLQAAGARRPQDFNALAAVDRVVLALLDPRLPLPADDWRRSPAATEYLRRAMVRRVAQRPDLEAALEPLVGQPAHLLALELIAVAPEPPGTRLAAQFLLRRLPGDRIADLLKMPGVSPEAKLDVLAHYVAAHWQLPPGCESLWHERKPTGPPPLAPTVLSRVLARLPGDTLLQFYRHTQDEHSDAFVAALVESCKRREAPTSGLTRILESMGDEAVLCLACTWGPTFIEGYPDDEPALGRQLQQILNTLPEHVSQFAERLDLVLAGRHLLPDDGSLDMATAWAACRAAIHDLGRLQDQTSGMLSRQRVHETEDSARRMTEAAARAMPRSRYDDDRHGAWKQERLRQVGRRLLGKSLLVPNVWQHRAIWQKITWFFETGRWPSTPLSRLNRQKLSPRNALLIGAGVAVVALGSLGLAMYLLGGGKPGDSPVANRQKPAASQPAASTPVKARPREDDPLAQADPPPPVSDAPAPSPEPPAAKPQETPPKRVQPKPAPDIPIHLDASRAATAGKSPTPNAMEEDDPDAPLEPKATEAAKRPVRLLPPKDSEWGDWAKQFAARLDAAVLDKQPLNEAKLDIPLSRFRDSLLAGPAFLSGGWLYLDRGAYEFGADFDPLHPAARHEVPGLAKQCRLKSVSVCVAPRSEGFSLMVAAEPEIVSPDDIAQRKKKLETLRKTRQLLIAHSAKWRNSSDTPAAQAAEREELIRLLNLDVPTLPPRPSRDDARFKEHAKAFDQELDAFRRKEAERQEFLDSVPRRAADGIRQTNDEIAAQETELNQLTSGIRRRNADAIEQLKSECRSVSVVVYRTRVEPDKAASAGKASASRKRSGVNDTPAETESPPPAPPQPPVAEPAAARLIPTVPARILDAPPRDAADQTTAQVVVRLSGVGLNPFKRDYLIGWQLTERGPDGALQGPTREIPDIDAESSCLTSRKTESVVLRFTFARRARGEGQAPRLVAQSAEHSVKVQVGKKHEVRLLLDAETQTMISRLKPD